ncbi:Hypothetical predicted protein [Paramuricea clavata]|uniref:Uncharacterized protein n=1 Tax=Paramuricea clavata TaxID=317549 RepID=A0A7D9IT91_PARCT|nr:Hypothetical predicted protein [Paramuricea clavata]
MGETDPITGEVTTDSYYPSSFTSNIFPTTNIPENKKTVINIKNEDDMCFKYAVTRALHPVEKKANVVSKLLRKQTEKYKLEGLTFPVAVKDTKIFSKNNDRRGYGNGSGRRPPNYGKVRPVADGTDRGVRKSYQPPLAR